MNRAACVLLVCVSACSGESPAPQTITAVEAGKELFGKPSLSNSQFNRFSCSTCHDATAGASTRILPGHPLGGVTARTRTWGGQERDLLTAVNFCLTYFMRGEPLTRDSPHGMALYEYLASLPGDAAVPPVTVVKDIEDVPRGDVERGRQVYEKACLDCHGATHTGDGRVSEFANILPNVASEYDALFPGIPHALVFVEKVRHGQFFGVGGNMPLFAKETLSDQDLGALLAYLGL